CLGTFGLPVIDQQADVVKLDAIPQRVRAGARESRGAKLPLDALDGLGAAPVIEIDPVVDDMVDREPVPCFEVALGGAGAIAKQRVMPVEALEQNAGDSERRIIRRGRIDGIDSGGGGHRIATITWQLWLFRSAR